MRRSSKESVSVWQGESVKGPDFPPLRDNISVDVCIVGAGIAGLTIGYKLAKDGKKVAIIDSWGLAAGETSRTTAHLTCILDDNFHELEKIFGQEWARHAGESHKSAVDYIEKIVNDEKIDCDYMRIDGFLVAPTSKEHEDFRKEVEAISRLGFTESEILPRVPIEGIKIDHTLRLPRQASFNITKYMNGLAKAFTQFGGKIYAGSHVSEVKGGDEAFVRTKDGFRVEAKHIVMATNTPVNDWVRMHTKQAAYRTYVIAYKIPKDAYPDFLLWDMDEPYHYVRTMRGDEYDMLIVGGEDHKTGQAYDMAARYKHLDSWTKRYFSTLGPIEYQWSGQVMEPVDCLGFIGRNPLDKENVYIVTGDSGNGMTHGTIAGMLIPDLIEGRNNPWEKLYDPSRKTVRTGGAYLKENANFVGHMVKDWVKPSEVGSIAEIKAGGGAIMRDGISKIAVYKDEQGHIYSCSAICTHLGCIVQWNDGEKSWDCPCHGSRFDTEGKILNGPAIAPLKSTSAKQVAKQKAAV